MTRPSSSAWQNIIQGLVLLATVSVMYGQFVAKLDGHEATLREMQRQTTRIEHYLSSQDREYWQKVARNGDTQ